jgi:hypothetical protein
MVYAVMAPIVSVLPVLLGCAALVGVGGPKEIYLIGALWFAWCAFQRIRDCVFIYGAIAKGRPWRDSYYDALYRAGASRAKAHSRSSWAWLHDPLMFLTTGACCVVLVGSYLGWRRPGAAPPPAPHVTHRR